MNRGYRRYLRSKTWRRKREKVLKRDEYRCRICNSELRLQVHHRTYKDLWHERQVDLITICKACHTLFHERSKLQKKKPAV